MSANEKHQQLEDVLKACLSNDGQTTKQATQILQSWENDNTLLVGLQEMVCNTQQTEQLRLMAMITLKNIVSRRWRMPPARGGPGDQERNVVRTALLQAVTFADKRLATQAAVALGRIARQDFPHAWPQLISLIAGGVTAQTPQTAEALHTQARVLLALTHVISELSQKRIRSDRLTFLELTTQLCPLLLECLKNHLQSVHAGCATLHDTTAPPLLQLSSECSLLALRTLKRFGVFGYDSTNAAVGETICSMLAVVAESLQQFYLIQTQRPELGELLELLTHKHVAFILRVTTKHLGVCVPVLPQLMTTMHTIASRGVITRANEQTIPSHRVLIKSLRFLKLVFEAVTGTPPQTDDYSAAVDSTALQPCVQSYATPEALQQLTTTLVTAYLRLSREDDLSLWASDPQLFFSSNQLDQFDTQLRPCAENLFLILLREFAPILSPLVEQMVQSTVGNTATEDDVLIRDAVLSAVSVGHWTLAYHLNFIDLYTKALAGDVQATGSLWWVRRNRVACLVGDWSETIPAEQHAVFYDCLVQLLATGDSPEAIVVRLSACVAIKAVVSEVEFDATVFERWLQPAIEGLIRLFWAVDGEEHRTLVAGVVSCVLQVMGPRVGLVWGVLAEAVPAMWKQNVHSPHVLRALTEALAHAVANHQGAFPPSMVEQLFVPIVSAAINTEDDGALVLAEDALCLWLSLLRCPLDPGSGALAPALVALFPNATQLVQDRNFDAVLLCLHVILEYVLVGGRGFLDTCAPAVVGVFDLMLPEEGVRDQCAVVVLSILDTILLLDAQRICAEPGFQRLVVRMLNTIAGSVNERESLQFLATHYLCFISRVAVLAQDWFVAFLAQNNNAAGAFVTSLIALFDNLTVPLQRKAVGMALCLVLARFAHDPSVAPSIPEALSLLVGLLADSPVKVPTAADNEDSNLLTVHDSCINYGDTIASGAAGAIDDEDWALQPPHSQRRLALAANDTVFVPQMADVLRACVGALRQSLGEQNFHVLAAGLDQHTREGLGSLGL